MDDVRYTHRPVVDANGEEWYRVEIESGESIYVKASGVTIALTHEFDLIEYHANRLARAALKAGGTE
jgi:hypothetical protein